MQSKESGISQVETQQQGRAAAAGAFLWKRSQRLETLKLTVEEYEHKATGAMHYHLASDNPENVFMLAFRTVPMDNTGVAHILEHTALCGSRKFPVRDPFFMMIRRSMNTFMNALTSSDWTAYPFASQNRKDFFNLLEVYLDAAFFSLLNELDFAQEGHRLEFAEPEKADSPLVYKGVVYNEMKGAMSSPVSTVWQLLCKHLYPTTTYHYNSGGEPADIPSLSYQQLRDFYRTHYHPSNAIFMTYGDIPAAELQEKFEELALKDFQRLDVHIAVDDEQRYESPVQVEEVYALDEEDTTGKTHVVMAWLLGRSTELEELYKAQLLSSVLLENSASPLLHALETSGLGRSPSPLCGLEDSHREMSFICGLEGCADNATEGVKQLVLDTLERIVREGIDQDKVEAALHTLELHQREISGDSYPYGLQLILAALSTATHRGDPLELLDIDPVLARLKEEIKDRDFVPRLIREYLLDNPHRVLLTVKPDAELGDRVAQAEQEKLAKVKAGLNEEQKRLIVERARQLEERQHQVDDVSILPKVELADVPAEIKWPDSEKFAIHPHGIELPVSFYAQGTNGLNYQQAVLALPQLPEEMLEILPYYTSCLPELGVGGRDYLQMQALQSRISGGLNCYATMRSGIDDEQQVGAYMVLSSKGLYPNHEALSQLLFDSLYEVRFDERGRIREIMEQIISRREQSITSQGHALAMGAASSRLSPLCALTYRQSGLEGIRKLKALSRHLKDEDQLAEFAARFKALHDSLVNGHTRFLLVAEADERDRLLGSLEKAWTKIPAPADVPAFSLPPTRESVREAWLTSTQVNFCAKAFPTVPSNHDDAPALTVLGGFLRNGFLHRAIREQGGAYGGGAAQDASSATFRFFSYRDPRLSETLDDFDRSIDWLLETEHEYAPLEEAILGVISSLDKPSSPAGTAKQAFYNELFGRSREQRARFRRKVLEVTVDRLKEVARKYLAPERGSVGVVSHKGKKAELEKLGLDIKTL